MPAHDRHTDAHPTLIPRQHSVTPVTRWPNFTNFFPCCLWPWLGLPPAALRYIRYSTMLPAYRHFDVILALLIFLCKVTIHGRDGKIFHKYMRTLCTIYEVVAEKNYPWFLRNIINWRYVALMVVLWRPALSSSSAASVTALR